MSMSKTTNTKSHKAPFSSVKHVILGVKNYREDFTERLFLPVPFTNQIPVNKEQSIC